MLNLFPFKIDFKIYFITVFALLFSTKGFSAIDPNNDAGYDSVKLNMKIYFPSKSLNKKYIITLTPRIGNYTFKEVWLMGEKGHPNKNQPTINYKYGGTVTYWDAISYKESIENVSLLIDIVVSEENVILEKTTLTIYAATENYYRHLNKFDMCTITAAVSLVKKK